MIRKSATIRDVAREAGVSIASVSYAINGIGTLSDDVRERVRLAAERLGYRPNRYAQAVRTGRSTMIGLIVPDLTSPSYPGLAQAIERAARQAGYTVALIDTAGAVEEEISGLRQLESQGAAGVIWCQTSAATGVEPGLSVPVVVVGHPATDLDSVVSDGFEGGRLLARYLVAMGHRSIGMVTADGLRPSTEDGRSGFLEGLGTAATIAWAVTSPVSIDLPSGVIDQIARRAVTAVMCGSDVLTIGALRAARRLGLRVPDDLSIVGFDDSSWSVIVEPQLTTVRHSAAETAALATTLLLDRIAEPERAVRKQKVKVELVVRDSVRHITADD